MGTWLLQTIWRPFIGYLNTSTWGVQQTRGRTNRGRSRLWKRGDAHAKFFGPHPQTIKNDADGECFGLCEQVCYCFRCCIFCESGCYLLSQPSIGGQSGACVLFVYSASANGQWLHLTINVSTELNESTVVHNPRRIYMFIHVCMVWVCTWCSRGPSQNMYA